MVEAIKTSKEAPFDPSLVAKYEVSCIMATCFENYCDANALLLEAELNIPINVGLAASGFLNAVLEFRDNKDAQVRIMSAYHHIINAYSDLEYDYEAVGKMEANKPPIEDKEGWIDWVGQINATMYSIPPESIRSAMELKYEVHKLYRERSENLTDGDVDQMESKLVEVYKIFLEAINSKNTTLDNS